MTFVLDRDTVAREGRQAGADVLQHLQACIIGGNAQQFRYDVPEEKEVISLGEYDSDETSHYDYPHQPMDSVIDLKSVRLRADEVCLEYCNCETVNHTGDHILLPYWPAEHMSGDRILLETEDGRRFMTQALKTTPVLPGEGDDECWDVQLARYIPEDIAKEKVLAVFFFAFYKDLEIPHETEGLANWHAESHGLTINPNIQLYDKYRWPDKPLHIWGCNLYVEYTAWRAEFTKTAYTATDDLDLIGGENTPENPLKYGVGLAMENANGSPIRFIAVKDPNELDSWREALARIGRHDVYGLVPMTSDEAVLGLFEEHVKKWSSEEGGRERVLWASISPPSTANVCPGRTMRAVATEAPGGGTYILQVKNGESAFLTDGIRPGDLVRFSFQVDDSYEEYVVHSVLNEEALVVQARGDVPTGNRHLEVWRRLQPCDMAQVIADRAKAYGSKRVRMVWPDRVSSQNGVISGEFLCAALAGLRSGCSPQQTLTGVEIAGILDVTRTDELFTDEQLDMMADLGVWVVASVDGVVVTQRGITTASASSGPEAYDESVVSNLDAIIKELRVNLEEVMGTAVSKQRITNLANARLRGVLNALTTTRVRRLGKRLLDSEVRAIRQHAYLNRLVLSVRLVLPVPPDRGVITDDVEVVQQIIA